MKRKSRELSISGMSAPDRFASVAGALILVAVVRLPCVPNMRGAERRGLEAAPFRAKGHGRFLSSVLRGTQAGEPRRAAFLERFAEAGGEEALNAGGTMAANLAFSLL